MYSKITKCDAREREGERPRQIVSIQRSSVQRDQAGGRIKRNPFHIVRRPSRFRSRKAEYGCTLDVHRTSQCSRQNCARTTCVRPLFPSERGKRGWEEGRRRNTRTCSPASAKDSRRGQGSWYRPNYSSRTPSRKIERSDFGKLSHAYRNFRSPYLPHAIIRYKSRWRRWQFSLSLWF